MEKRIIRYFVAGDESPDTQFRFLGLDISTGYTSITLVLRREDNSVVSRAVVPEVGDTELGKVSWQTGDLISGRHSAEIQFVEINNNSFTLPQRYPMIFKVRAAL